MALVKMILLIPLVAFLFYPFEKVGISDDSRFVAAESQLGKRPEEIIQKIGLPHSEESCTVTGRVDGNDMPIPGQGWEYRTWERSLDTYVLTLCFVFDRVVEERTISILSQDGKVYVESRSITDEQLIQRLLIEQSKEHPKRFLLRGEFAI